MADPIEKGEQLEGFVYEAGQPLVTKDLAEAFSRDGYVIVRYERMVQAFALAKLNQLFRSNLVLMFQAILGYNDSHVSCLLCKRANIST